MSKKMKTALEAITVLTVAGVLFYFSRKAGIEFRGNTRIGGEVCIPLLFIGCWYFTRGVIRDIKGGLFRE